jgi:hypothetical protein
MMMKKAVNFEDLLLSRSIQFYFLMNDLCDLKQRPGERGNERNCLLACLMSVKIRVVTCLLLNEEFSTRHTHNHTVYQTTSTEVKMNVAKAEKIRSLLCPVESYERLKHNS